MKKKLVITFLGNIPKPKKSFENKSSIDDVVLSFENYKDPNEVCVT